MNSHHTVAIGTWEGDKQQSIEYNSSIAVGIDSPCKIESKYSIRYNTRVSGEIYLF